MNKPLIFAHRGASTYAPENTLSALKKAIDIGVDGIEIDVQLTKDEVVVAIHDPLVDRTSDGKGSISSLTLLEAKKLDFGGWFSNDYKGEKIPTLKQILQLLDGWQGILNIELKKGHLQDTTKLAKGVLKLLYSYNYLKQTIISSFDQPSLIAFKGLEPKAKICPLYGLGLKEPWIYATNIHAFAIHPPYQALTAEIVENCHSKDIKVNVFTVNQSVEIKTMIELGVDGIITDVPDIAKEIRDGI